MHTARGEIPDRLWRSGLSMGEAHEYLTRPSRRRFLTTSALVGTTAALGTGWFFRPARAAGIPAAGVHVAFGDDPRSQVTITWSTAVSVVGPEVVVGPPGEVGATIAAESRVAPGHGVSYHHASVSDLDAATTYAYRILSEPVVEGTFTTAPAGPQAFRFATFGDMGATADGLAITQRIVEADPALVFAVGDLCYADKSGGLVDPPPELGGLPGVQDLTQWDLWFEQIRSSAASIPWMPTVGNHEMETGQGPLGYDGVFARLDLPRTGPSDDSPAYVIRYGSVAFVALDGNDVSAEIRANQGYTGGAQDRWLRSTLTALRAEPSIEFIVVGFHNCMYCTNAVHSSDGGNRTAWGPIFDEFSVDLVINGHNHSYERTDPIRGEAPTVEAPIGSSVTPAADGTVYVTAGAGGQAAYPSVLYPAGYVWTQLDVLVPAVPVPESADWSRVRYAGDHSVVIIDVVPRTSSRPGEMRLQALATDGTVVDRLTIVGPPVTAAPSVTPPAAPLPPPADPADGPSGADRLPATGGRDRLLVAAALGAAGTAAATLRRATDQRGLSRPGS